MPVSAKTRYGRRLVVARRRFPPRTLHLVDIENLAGAAIPSLVQVMDVQDRYARSLSVGLDDQVVMASSHLGFMNAALGWPHARYRVRSGPDGADLELLDVIWHEDVATRFTHIVIGSGDGTFVNAAQTLSDGGVWVTVVSRWGSLSPRLAHAARDVIYLDNPAQAALSTSPPEAAQIRQRPPGSHP
jgi:hypothetical protein